MKRAFKTALLFTFVSIVSFLIALPYMSPLSKIHIKQLRKVEHLTITLEQYLFAAGGNGAINVFIFSFAGLLLANRVGLKLDWIYAVIERNSKPKWNKKYLLTGVGWGMFVSAVISFFTIYFFEPLLPELEAMNKKIARNVDWRAGMTTIFQGGFSEELIMRLGVMTILVWVLSNVFAWKKDTIPPWIYWSAIFTAAFMFGAGHLSFARTIFGEMNELTVCYVLVANSLSGLGFGFLYWKGGLEYAIVAHITADFMLHVALPLLI